MMGKYIFFLSHVRVCNVENCPLDKLCVLLILWIFNLFQNFSFSVFFLFLRVKHWIAMKMTYLKTKKRIIIWWFHLWKEDWKLVSVCFLFLLFWVSDILNEGKNIERKDLNVKATQWLGKNGVSKDLYLFSTCVKTIMALLINVLSKNDTFL